MFLNNPYSGTKCPIWSFCKGRVFLAHYLFTRASDVGAFGRVALLALPCCRGQAPGPLTLPCQETLAAELALGLVLITHLASCCL